MHTVALEVRELDVDDDRLMRRWYELTEAADTYQRPWATQWSFEEMLVQFRDDDGAMRWLPTGAFEGEEMVGAGLMVLPLLDNTEKVYGGVFVEPGLRNRGIGSTVLMQIVEAMRGAGRTTLLVESGIPGSARDDHPYARFARRHGFRMANVEVHRVLDLPLESGLLDAMQAEAVTPEIFRRQLHRLLGQGRHRLMSLAISPDGEVVAHSDLVVPRADRPKVYQWGTLVRRDHRGHHLGAAVKLANLRALQERYPDRTEIHTTNSETNATMIGINERLGFRVVEICPEFQLKI